MIQFKNADSVFQIKGLSQVVEVPLGASRMLILSGQVPVNQKGEVVGSDIRTQSRQVFQNIQSVLEYCGANFNDIVKLGIFTTDISKIAEFREVRDQFINTTNPPASSLLEVKGLFRKDVFIEVEVTAIVKNK
ncbi:putative translation initiation inhibitor, yjgF family protein [Elizabethkingia anophelis R26]|uniref:Endoribonuclease L-PSP n=2 Tax=Weeksellaceae TaxID=2762318 RepID=A0A077EDD5_9FLAO|nr:Endoribonuclease L-PSP [Elizabethkingia anophelis NUHP1]AQW92547.1 endoribonuclease L-PSP [Elizabethkingia anophelis]ELR79129.1 putative translation initiation inhibitor, yjgF family protein [Elizabethkingia anophelis R26]KMU61031.1 Endoribonuclease L-PSP [Elizabethkingia anophelis]OPB80199.1 endoribonuclease L-PSP [Elizabethkingia anophelis]